MIRPQASDSEDLLSSDNGLKSLVKVMRLLDCFSVSKRTLSLTDLSEAASLPKSTTHRLLGAMTACGLLNHTGRDRYRLGIKLFELGNTVLANMDLHREARPFVDALMRQSGQAIHLAVFDGERAIVVHRAEASPEKFLAAHTIEQAPVHCTGVGKAILAFQPTHVVTRIIASGLMRFTDTTITGPAEFRRELVKIRGAGYAVDEGEHQPGLRCVGAPIRDQSGQVVAAISLTGPAWQLPLSEIKQLANMVIHYAGGISNALGYRGPGRSPHHSAHDTCAD